MYRTNRTKISFTCTVFLLTLSMFLSPSIGLGKENTRLTDPLIEHLEFLGYQCDLVEKGIRAKHHSKIHLYITYFQGGIHLQTGFPGKKEISGLARYEVLNTLNKANQVARFYWSTTGNLFGIAWMPGAYDRTRFSTFLAAWDHDTQNLRNAYEHLKPYLEESTEKTHAESSETP